MGIFKKLINKVLDAEVPPVFEQLVKKELAKKQAKEKPQSKKVSIVPKIGKVVYAERYIPDDSDEAKRIRAEREKYKDETTSQRLKRLVREDRERKESADLTMYVWETAGDERVRPCCRKMDGKLCLWTDPTVYSRNKGRDWISRPKGATLTHPGEEEGCRCTAIAYWQELVGEL